MVSSLSEDGDITGTSSDYSRLYDLATDAYHNLSSFGNEFELGRLITPTWSSSSNNKETENDNQENTAISTEIREKLQTIGRNLWMAVRSHPSVFLDSTFTQVTTSNPHASAENDAVTRGCSTGFVRLIAARLILLDYIATKDQPFPKILNQRKGGDIRRTATLPIASPSELEFGLRSFVKAGRAILARGSVAKEAYGALLLALECWNCINFVARGGGDGDVSTAMTAASVASKNLDDAFDGAVLLPDACHSALLTVQTPQGRATELVLKGLKDIDKFVRDYCINAVQDGEDKSDSGISLSAIQRYLPCLARVAYKHGNRFAQYKDFAGSNGALEIVLTATNDCLRGIRSRVSESSRKSVCQALQVQEQEMLVVAKQASYVLSYVCVETGRAHDAHACLDQIERYIEEEKARGDEQFAKTMRNLDNDAKSKLFPSSFAGSDLLEGELS